MTDADHRLKEINRKLEEIRQSIANYASSVDIVGIMARTAVRGSTPGLQVIIADELKVDVHLEVFRQKGLDMKIVSKIKSVVFGDRNENEKYVREAYTNMFVPVDGAVDNLLGAGYVWIYQRKGFPGEKE